MKLLKSAWAAWLKITKAIGNFQAQVLFTIFYFVLIFPLGIAIRFFSDPLNMKTKKINSNFNKWEHIQDDINTAQKPY